MNCLVVDDEPLAIEVIESYVEKIPSLTLIKACTSAIEALNIIQSESVDLVFLDIQMPNLTGVDFIKTLSNPPLIVFTTAYSKYALEGFELNAVDYLVKPIPFDRFIKAVNKAQELFQLRNTKPQVGQVHEKAHIQNFIMVKADYSMIKIDLDDILYIEGLKDYLKIFVKDRKAILTLNSFKKFEEKLPQYNFIRVHRSYIVALNKIESIQRNRIIIKGERIPVGDNYKESFYDRLKDFNLS